MSEAAYLIAGVATLLCVLFLLPAAPRRGCGVNDLSRWKQFGGHLDRPPPPAPTRPRREGDAA